MDSGAFIEKIEGEYKFAKEQGFDGINIVVETSDGEYEISELEDGFSCDNLDGIYSEVNEISGDLFSAINIGSNVIEGIRIE